MFNEFKTAEKLYLMFVRLLNVIKLNLAQNLLKRTLGAKLEIQFFFFLKMIGIVQRMIPHTF